MVIPSKHIVFCGIGEAVKAYLCGMEDQVNKCSLVLTWVLLLSLSCCVCSYCSTIYQKQEILDSLNVFDSHYL